MHVGLRCSNLDYTIALMDGTKTNPTLLSTKTFSFPKNYGPAQRLKWLYRELRDLTVRNSISCIAIKGAEPLVRKTTAFVTRVEHEAIAFLVAADAGVRYVVRKTNSTIAKDLGLKGKAKYLSTSLDTTPIPQFVSLASKDQEAVLVAWSCLK